MLIQILTDNPKSWIVAQVSSFVAELEERGSTARHIYNHSDIIRGDVLVLLGCEKILSAEIRQLNKYNLVVHESRLPSGKGWSPLTWQVLEGATHIPVSLIEAHDSVDSGVVYDEERIVLMGNELVDELRAYQARASFELIRRFLDRYPNVVGQPQAGTETFYPKRKAADSELDPKLSIEEQFDLLRVVDNERYPAFFRLRGRTYKLKIEVME